MIGLTSGGILNIFLDFLMVSVLHMGIGGAERVCVNLANEFADKGNEVHIVVLNLENDVNTHLLDSRVQVHSLGVSRLRYAAPAMLRYVKKYRPPFLFVFGNEMAVILKHVIAQCDAMKEQLLEKKLVKKEQISRVYNPVSRDLIAKTMEIRIPFAKREADRTREIVFIGRLDPQKNLPHLVEAFAMLHKKMPNTCLRLIGTGNLIDAIKKLVEDKGICECVIFEGVCKNMENIYAKADMIVLSSEYEGMPNCLIEAIGCGIPIVSYDCPIGPREIVVDDVNGYLVKYNDINQLAEKMEECLKCEWDEESIRRTAEKFDVSYIAKEYIDLFEKVTRK